MILSGLRISMFVSLSECASGHTRLSQILPSQLLALMQLRSDVLHQSVITLP